jgi:hypothetical protein
MTTRMTAFSAIQTQAERLIKEHRAPMTDEQVLRGLHMRACRLLDVQLALRASVASGALKSLPGGRFMSRD